MVITYKKHTLKFTFEAGTSRGVMTQHDVYFICIKKHKDDSIFGLGEAAPLPGLSIDYIPEFENRLQNYCQILSQLPDIQFIDIYNTIPEVFPSIRFAFETALLDLKYEGKRKIFSNDFSEKKQGISINGLIWMGDKNLMLERINQKLTEGYHTLKLKIGGIKFSDELELLETIRGNFSADKITIRVDANGALESSEALNKLKLLSKFDIHSIEQPIAAGQKYAMKKLVEKSPIPIALDEELIGVFGVNKYKLIQTIKPQFIILKPTLLGGYEATNDWIKFAESHQMQWWVTSALESNIGLNGIAQFVAEHYNTLPQGLGTGQLYSNNVQSPLTIHQGKLFYDQNKPWNLAITQ